MLKIRVLGILLASVVLSGGLPPNEIDVIIAVDTTGTMADARRT